MVTYDDDFHDRGLMHIRGSYLIVVNNHGIRICGMETSQSAAFIAQRYLTYSNRW
jgi:hypothetical protein